MNALTKGFHNRFLFIAIVTMALLVLTGCSSGSSTGSTGGNSNMVRLNTPTSEMLDGTSAPATLSGEVTFTPTLTPEVSFTPTQTATVTMTFTPTATATLLSTATSIPTPTPLPAPFLDTFIANLVNGNQWQVVGVYVEDVLALRVVQQPSSDPAYVSTLQNTATYFAMVNQVTGNTGLLAHNYLAGNYFFNLAPGQVAVIIYGDGNTEEYVVSGSQEYQALSPNSPTSNFVNLDTGETLSSTDLFYHVFGGGSKTTFQTCIAQGSEDSWGRLFVIAPLE